MMPLLRSGMPELTQQKQKEGKATCSRKGDSISRRCCRGILLGQGPFELVTSFASRETRRHDVGRALQPLIRPQGKGFSRGIM